MYATNFEYDGLKLSDFGMMICRFDTSGLETVSSGADVTFHTVKSSGSDKFRMYGSGYEESYASTFQICRDPCHNGSMYLEANEVSALQRWLCKKDGYHHFHPIQDDLRDIYWNAAFQCKQISLGGRIIGLELTLCTDSPYAYVRQAPISYSVAPGESFSLYNTSDEVGWIYPIVTIACRESGNIKLWNHLDSEPFRSTKITNVSENEIITLNGETKIITSSSARTDLPDHFSFNFPRIANKIVDGADVRENIFTLSDDSVSCEITFTYSPIIKVGL